MSVVVVELVDRERLLLAMRPKFAGEREKRARWYAKRIGAKGAAGGWIYKEHRALAQGYIGLYNRYANRIEEARIEAGLVVLGEGGGS